MEPVTDQQLHLLHHTLGLRPDCRKPFRNHFVAGPGHHDQPDLEALEVLGLVQRGRTPAFCDQDDVVFHATDAGRALALDRLPPEPKYSRYEEYQRSEYSESFACFLGIRVPELETDYGWGGQPTKYRYCRSGRYSWEDVRGEWKQTKKDAKASYKAALRKRQAERRAAAC